MSPGRGRGAPGGRGAGGRGSSGRGAPGGRGPGGTKGRGGAGGAGGNTGGKGRGGASGGAKRPSSYGGVPGQPRSAPVRPPANRDEVGGSQVEGRQAVRELLLAGRRRVREIWLADDLDPAPIIDDIIGLAQEERVTLTRVSRKRLDTAARTEAPQGVLAFAAGLVDSELDGLATPAAGLPMPFLLALDSVNDPGNLGALLRSAEGAGVTGVILPKHRAVHVTPTVTKTAAGAIEYLRFSLVGGLPNALNRLRELGVWTIGLDAGGDRSLFDLDVDVVGAPVCLVLGAEGAGLSNLVRRRCDEVVAIPLDGRLSSLNVSAAATLACFEIARRRQAKGRDPATPGRER